MSGGGDDILCGYFNLPRSASGAGLQLLPMDAELCESALACARGAVADIARGRFWPPSKVRYDDFERLFPLGIEEFVPRGIFDAEGVLT